MYLHPGSAPNPPLARRDFYSHCDTSRLLLVEFENGCRRRRRRPLAPPPSLHQHHPHTQDHLGPAVRLRLEPPRQSLGLSPLVEMVPPGVAIDISFHRRPFAFPVCPWQHLDVRRLPGWPWLTSAAARSPSIQRSFPSAFPERRSSSGGATLRGASPGPCRPGEGQRQPGERTAVRTIKMKVLESMVHGCGWRRLTAGVCHARITPAAYIDTHAYTCLHLHVRRGCLQLTISLTSGK